MSIHYRSKPDEPLWETQSVIYGNGNMYLSNAVVTEISCPADVTNFPVDEQTCELRVCNLHEKHKSTQTLKITMHHIFRSITLKGLSSPG